MRDWRIGQKIVCIRSGFYRPECCNTLPQKGTTYTVRAVGETGIPLIQNVFMSLMGERLIGILLREITNPPCDCLGGAERGFDQDAFRPVIEDQSKSTETVEQFKQRARDLDVKTPEKVR